MKPEERLKKALAKIEKRKQRQREKGITEPTRFSYVARDLIAPVFRGVCSLLYPKSGFVLLGDTDRKKVKKLTAGRPVIYAVAHRSVWDAARFIAYAIPHSYAFSGDEKAHYCTINEAAFELNGVLHFDRDDKKDCETVVARGVKILTGNNHLLICPEGVPNVYGRGMLRLYPGIIKMALESNAIIIPVGNEIHILIDKHTGKISGDVNYMMYEDYSKQSLFKPSDDKDLVLLHNYLKVSDYRNISDNKEIETFINNGLFQLGEMTFDLNEKMSELLISHPLVNDYYRKLSAETEDSALLQNIRDYLIKCSTLYEYRKRLISCLSIHEQRMKVLSEMIVTEIDKRHPTTQEERERNEREYVDYYLDVHEKVAKKGRSTAYEEIDRYINKTTDGSIIESSSRKIIEGIINIENHAK